MLSPWVVTTLDSYDVSSYIEEAVHAFVGISSEIDNLMKDPKLLEFSNAGVLMDDYTKGEYLSILDDVLKVSSPLSLQIILGDLWETT